MLDTQWPIYLPGRRSRSWVRGDGCWQWMGWTMKNGYGQATMGARKQLAHRAFYETFVGPIPSGLTLDHLCRHRYCTNPKHLEPVTNRENVLRGTGFSAQHAAKTHCPKGHPYNEANTYWYGGSRQCRTCRVEHDLRKRQVHREAIRLRAADYRARNQEAINARARARRKREQ